MKQIWFIHGAYSSSLSFNWLKANLCDHEPVDISYNSSTPLVETIDYLRSEVTKCHEPPLVIGHSLGGIIAAAISQTTSVDKIVTMATPFGGSFAASVLSWFLPTQLMRDISQQNPILSGIRRSPPKVPMLSFVTDANLTVMGERTDGVVTVRSQTALNGPKYITVPISHFEVLMSPSVVGEINNFFFGEAA